MRNRVDGFKIAAIVGFACGGAMVGWLFYDSPLVSALSALVMGCAAPKWRRQRLKQRRDEELLYQFQHAVTALSSTLAAGRSVEQAIKQTIADLRMLYPSGDAEIIAEFQRMDARLSYGEPVEKCFHEFAERAGLDEIRQFVEIFAVCKRTGGNLRDVMRKTADVIRDKIDVARELQVMVASKRWEAKALGGAPIGFLLFLRWSSPEYMMPLYSPTGRAVMTAALAVFAGCFYLMRKIVDIRL